MISIIGAGPSGSYLAFLLAKSGKKVQIFEEHSSVGRPVQCTGIVTSSISRFIRLKKEFVINNIGTARIYSPNGEFVETKLKNPDIILNREKFDRHLAKKAVEAGALLHLNSKFVGFENKKLLIRQKNSIKKISSEYVIGADGPLSAVAKQAGLYGKRRFLTGIQALARLKNNNAVEFYPFAGGFAWVVPESRSIVRIGLAAKQNVSGLFNSFLKNKSVYKERIIEKQGGIIPIYKRIQLKKGNIYLLGDAALQVKATTGGGIVQGFTAARALAESICRKKDYSVLLRKLRFELWIHKKARDALNRLSPEDYNKLIAIFQKPKNKRVLESIDRDSLSLIALKILLTEPRLLQFLKYLI